MANTAALLANLLEIDAKINFYSQQSIYFNRKYEATHKKVAELTKLEEKWQDAFDDAQNVDKKCMIGNTVYKEKDQVLSDAEADRYAHLKVKDFDENVLIDLTEDDMEYDKLKTVCDTMLEKLRADQTTAKEATSKAAGDTGLLQS